MRRTQAMVMMSSLVFGVLSLIAAPATAQTGYPPGPCDVLSGSQFAGNVIVGQTFTVTVAPTCLFTPGSTATIVVNGSTPFTKQVNSDGTVTLTITILSTTEASINPIVPVACGINTIQVTAPSAVAGGRNVTQTVTFNLVCPGIPIINICNAGDGGAGGNGLGLGGNATGGTGTGSGTSTGGAGTGTAGSGGSGGDACNVTLISGLTPTGGSAGGGGGAGGAGGGGGAGGAGGSVGATGTPGAPGAPGTPGAVGVVGGFLARTGGDFAPFAAGALALVMVGTVLTVAARRRRATH